MNFRVDRTLKRYENKDGKRQVLIRVRFDNGKMYEIPVYKYVGGQRNAINVKKGNWFSGFVKGGSYDMPERDLNFLISQVEHKVKSAVNELIEKNIVVNRKNIIQLAYINEENFIENERKINSGEVITNEDGGSFASEAEFVDFIETTDDPKLDDLKKSIGVYEKKYILDYWNDFIQNYAPDSYSFSFKVISDYVKDTGDNCLANAYNKEWLKRFFIYLLDKGYSLYKDGRKRKPYAIKTLMKHKKHMISFGDYLFKELELIDNQDYKRFRLINKIKKKSLINFNPEPFANNHALMKEEFDQFFAYHFTNKDLDLARDMFILQTWMGGLRKSDFYNLSNQSIQKDQDGNYRIDFAQLKTDQSVHNFVNKNYLEPIFKKYLKKLPEFLDEFNYNKKLKEATYEAGLKRKLMFRIENASAKRAEIKYYPIFKRISNNWARNCAVSILAEQGFPDDFIIRFTGHRDTKMVKYYKKIHDKDVKSMIDSVKPSTRYGGQKTN